METENLVLDERGQGQVVEEIGEVFPHRGVAIFAEAFVVESVHLGDLTRFVVAAQDGDAVWVADFEGDEEGYGFHGEVAAVYVVAWKCVSDKGVGHVVRQGRVMDEPMKR